MEMPLGEYTARRGPPPLAIAAQEPMGRKLEPIWREWKTLFGVVVRYGGKVESGRLEEHVVCTV